uniref:Uncharacterized protein n=1 Tax=Anopheles quadriannulatus TaxID=34691 RepID=A0A182XQA0_ANOQN
MVKPFRKAAPNL